jgi:hypothetical protein
MRGGLNESGPDAPREIGVGRGHGLVTQQALGPHLLERQYYVWNRERGENAERKGVLSPLPPRNSLKKWWAVKDSSDAERKPQRKLKASSG